VTDFSAFHGVYQIESETLNRAGCDVEGSAMANPPPLAVVYSSFALGAGKIAAANSCSDLAACRARAANPSGTYTMTGSDFDATFKAVSADGNSMIGTSLESCCNAGQCQDVGGSDSTLRKDGDSIRIVMHEHLPDSTAGTCSAKLVSDPLAFTCEILFVVQARYQDSL